jgi:hypothetical protein
VPSLVRQNIKLTSNFIEYGNSRKLTGPINADLTKVILQHCKSEGHTKQNVTLQDLSARSRSSALRVQPSYCPSVALSVPTVIAFSFHTGVCFGHHEVY